jgi:hypothetical protein
VAKERLERQLSSGHHISVSLESLDIPAHSLLTATQRDEGIRLALVNVLDVAEESIRKLHLPAPEPRSVMRSSTTNPVGGACGEDPQRISNR